VAVAAPLQQVVAMAELVAAADPPPDPIRGLANFRRSTASSNGMNAQRPHKRLIARAPNVPQNVLNLSRQLTDTGDVEITGRDLREKTPPVGQGSLFARATAG